MVVHLRVAFIKVACPVSRCTSRVSNPYKTHNTWIIYENSSGMANVLQAVRAVGRRKTQEKLLKDKIQYTR
jgi:hypothetical protein